MDSNEVDKDYEHPPIDAKPYAVPANEHVGSLPSSSVQLNDGKSLSNTSVAQTVGDAYSYESLIEAPAQQPSTSGISYGAITSDASHFHADEKDIQTDMTSVYPVGNISDSNVQEQEAPPITNEIATTENISSQSTEKLVDMDTSHAPNLQDYAGAQGSQEAPSTTTVNENQSMSKGKEIDFSTSEEVETSTSAGPNDIEDAEESTQPHPNIEVDSNPRYDSDADSAIGSMPASSTVSLRESVFNYIEENGRTYHAFQAGNLQHHLFVVTMDNKLHLAPIRNPQNVLDIATGTGIWAIEFAEEFPSASVLGTDLSPIQPA
ncbi:hypothetical protein EG329_012816 [Mollisiaceae sp. DMI_Dod_QoI]|nr:hypothetical protein EG329_012816 [Helotiales sp. DMI_Dod_QoI]